MMFEGPRVAVPGLSLCPSLPSVASFPSPGHWKGLLPRFAWMAFCRRKTFPSKVLV